MTNARFHRLFGGPPRRPEEAHLSRAIRTWPRSIQAVTEEVVLRLARTRANLTGAKNLCLAGGVALNCVANGACSAKGFLTASGSNPPPATPAARWAPPSRPGTRNRGQPHRRGQVGRHARRAPWPANIGDDEIEAALTRHQAVNPTLGTRRIDRLATSIS